MSNEKRIRQAPIPDNYEEILTDFQLLTIRNIERFFGGELWFVRRHLFQSAVPIVKYSRGENCEVAIVEGDGTLNKEHGLIIRQDLVSTTTNIIDFITNKAKL